MTITIRFVILLTIMLAVPLFAQPQWQPVSGPFDASLRGLDVVDSKVIWVTGSKGTVAVTSDGGKTWKKLTVPGGEDLDFRDVEAFDAQRAIIMSSGEGARSKIFRTADAGKTWHFLYASPHKKGFFNTIAFRNHHHGFLIGDPIDDRPMLMRSRDGGANWKRIPPDTLPMLRKSEYGFAASGTCIALQGSSHIWLATGGGAARVMRSTDNGASWQVSTTPMIQGAQTQGIYSIAFRDLKHGVIVGGDYTKPEQTSGTMAWTNDGGITWSALKKPEVGFRSCVVPMKKPGHWMAVGRSGSSVSYDDGQSWRSLSGNYYAASFAKDGTGWASGAKGRMAVFKKP